MNYSLKKKIFSSDSSNITENYILPKVKCRLYQNKGKEYYISNTFIPLMLNPNWYIYMNYKYLIQKNINYFINYAILYIKEREKLELILNFQFYKSIILKYHKLDKNMVMKKLFKLKADKNLDNLIFKIGFIYKRYCGLSFIGNNKYIKLKSYFCLDSKLSITTIKPFISSDYDFNKINYGLNFKFLNKKNKEYFKTKISLDSECYWNNINYLKIYKKFWIGIGLRIYKKEINYNLELKVHDLYLSIFLKNFDNSNYKLLDYTLILFFQILNVKFFNYLNKKLKIIKKNLIKIFKKPSLSKVVDTKKLSDFNIILKNKNKNKKSKIQIKEAYLTDYLNSKIDISGYIENLIINNKLNLWIGDKSDYFFTKKLNSKFKIITIKYLMENDSNTKVIEKNLYEEIIIN